MIRLRQTIERGVRHRWLGPLFVILLCLLLALVYLHTLHDGHSTGAELGELCVGITMIIGAVLLIRLRLMVAVPLLLVRDGRAPPDARPLPPVRATAAISSPPLRI